MKIHKYTKDIVEICNMKHLSADNIFIQLKRKYPNVAKASIYRNIDKLVELWELNEISLKNNKKKFFEKNIWKHIHLVDQNGIIYDMPFPADACNFQLPDWFSTNQIDITIYGKTKKSEK